MGTWTFYTWEDDVFSEPAEAIDRWELTPGDIFVLDEVEARIVGLRRWQVSEDGGLIKLPDGDQS